MKNKKVWIVVHKSNNKMHGLGVYSTLEGAKREADKWAEDLIRCANKYANGIYDEIEWRETDFEDKTLDIRDREFYPKYVFGFTQRGNNERIYKERWLICCRNVE